MSFFNSQQNPEIFKRNLARYVAGALVVLLLNYMGIGLWGKCISLMLLLFSSIIFLPIMFLGNAISAPNYLLLLSVIIFFVTLTQHFRNKALKNNKPTWFFNSHNKAQKILCLAISTYIWLLPLVLLFVQTGLVGFATTGPLIFSSISNYLPSPDEYPAFFIPVIYLFFHFLLGVCLRRRSFY
jgi:hypothetical protein